jgi:hypothetical protein
MSDNSRTRDLSSLASKTEVTMATVISTCFTPCSRHTRPFKSTPDFLAQPKIFRFHCHSEGMNQNATVIEFMVLPGLRVTQFTRWPFCSNWRNRFL